MTADLAIASALVGVARALAEVGLVEDAARALAEAQNGYAEVCAFLADPDRNAGLPDQARSQLKAETEQLRDALERVRT